MLPPNAIPNVTPILVRAAILLQHFDEKRREAARREIARCKRHFAGYPDSEMTISAMMIRFRVAAKQLLRSADCTTDRRDVFSLITTKVQGLNLDLTSNQVIIISHVVVAVSDYNKKYNIGFYNRMRGMEE
jgi:hypothetical protein